MRNLYFPFVVFLIFSSGCIKGVANKPGTEAFVFTHPGLLNSKAELDFLKEKIKSNAEPWKSAFNKMKSSSFGNVNWVPKPIVVVDADWSPSKNDAGTENDDATAAYTQALLWYFTDNEAYAKKSVEILNAWSGKLTGHTSRELQKQLVAGWCGSLFPMAAEIMRSSYPKWTSDEIAKFSVMLNKAFLPLLINGNPKFNGNWELSIINAMMCIGVFNEDTTTFNKAIFLWRKRVPAYIYLTTDGISPIRPYGTSSYNSESGIKGYWFNPPKYFDGLCQETCRDWGHHMQMGLASAINSAEIAWHQGIDLYSENEKRLLAALEFQASAQLGNPVSKELFPNGFAVDINDNLPTWEIGYNHFHNRKGLALPMTDALINKKIRPSYFNTMLNMAWETATHAQLNNYVGTSIKTQIKTDGDYSLKISPNPVNSNFRVQYKVKELSSVEFTMNDINGNLVEKLEIKNVQTHSGDFKWTIKSNPAPGIYFINMQQDGKKAADFKLVKSE